MKLIPFQLKLRTKIALLSFTLVLLSVLLAGVVIVERTTAAEEKEIGMRALAIARTVAELKDLQENLGKPEGAKTIQPIAERIRLATGVEYIVAFDMARIRYSHPLEDRIGTVFDDGDEWPSLRKQEYLSQAVGVAGPSIRAFVPVMTDEGTRQVGAVAVGILVPTITEALRALRLQLYSSLLIGVAFGVLGSIFLARNIKKNMFSLEPQEIARILEERVAIFQSLGEGVIAVDREFKITVKNMEAVRITGDNQGEVGELLSEGPLQAGINGAMDSGEAQLNRELALNETVVLANFLPIKVKEKVVGGVVTFRDKTEVNKMAEELTGVKTFIEGLRVQNHEYLNKLHTIAGLIQLRKHQQALDYVFAVTEEQQEVTQFLSRHILNPAVAGLLLGKYNRSKELKVEMFFEEESFLGEVPCDIETSSLVIIIGNLVENALEAVIGQKLQEVHCSIKQEAKELIISVEDTGPGISPERQERIFEWGYTTKGFENRGIGLYLIKTAVDKVHGTLELESGNWGTRFVVKIPIQVQNAKA